MSGKKKILFFSHAVTMAHFARPLKWIEGLNPKIYDIYLASNPKFKKFCPKEGVTFIESACLDDMAFADAVRRTAPFYDASTFEKHINDDLRVMDLVEPDLVIGDFRHSLSVSCRRRKIKYVNITNAYWSLEVMLAPPLPETPIIRVVGETLAKLLLKPLVPLGLRFSFFKMAFVIRKSLRGAGLFFSDYRQLLTDGDVTLYCDTPGLVPLKKQLDRERFIGPLVWSMPERLPDWWERLNPKKKRIFLTMGSSGPADSLPLIISSLSKLDVEVIVALAGRKLNLPSFSNVHITDYLPIKEACQNSDLVICNGGSPMSHAALAYGAPTIGIICNNDQLLNMAHIEKRGAGLMLRYWNLTEKKITASVNEILKNSKYAQNSQAIKVEFDSINVPERLQNVIEETMGNQL